MFNINSIYILPIIIFISNIRNPNYIFYLLIITKIFEITKNYNWNYKKQSLTKDLFIAKINIWRI